jgi:hypothetical protein
MVSWPPAAALATPSRSRQDQGQRAGPEGVDQALREIGPAAAKVRHGAPTPGHMHDQRVVAGPALGGKDAGDAASLPASAPRP